MKSLMQALYRQASTLNLENILDSLPSASTAKLLDLGCDDGKWTSELGRRMGTRALHGVEIVEAQAAKARALGIEVSIADLNGKLPYANGSFDVVHANQVIEHLADVDTFVAETHRVLKPGGVAVVSTENGSSWHNIFAAMMGWQIFSLTNFSRIQSGIGNPLALHRKETLEFSSWTHKVIFNYRGLREFFLLHGFRSVEIRGAGYHPLPAVFGKIDPRHAHFLTVRATK